MKVLDEGPWDAKIMIVSDAPAADDMKRGIPFVSQEGVLLKNILSSSGVSYGDCYVTHVMPETPSGDKFKYFYSDKRKTIPTPILQLAIEQLHNKIRKLNPNVVIALGEESLRALTNKRSLKNYRGIIIQALGTKVISTYHPYSIMRNYEWRPIAQLDISKAYKHKDTNKYSEPPVQLTLKPNLTEVIDFISKIKNRVGWDLETVGTSVRCIGLATGDITCPKSIVIPLIAFASSGGMEIKNGTIKILNDEGNSSSSYWSSEDELIVLDLLNKLFMDEKIEKVGQNSMSFDVPVLFNDIGITVRNHYLDTMHAHHDLYSEFPMSLNFICSMYTDYPNYWSEKVTSIDMSEWKYCAYDSIVCYVASYRIEQDLKAANMWDYYRKIRVPLAESLAQAQIEGIDFDDKRRNELLKEQNLILEDYQKNINEIAKGEININSPAQISTLLYEKMGFPKVYNGKSITSDEKALRALERKYPNQPILENIVMYRKTKKLISTYLSVKTDSDGKIRTSWNPSGTDGGRISSSKPILTDTGIQMQNIPKGHNQYITNIRDIFIAGEGNVFIVGDLKQAEAMIVASILKRLGFPELYNLYKDPEFDIHTWAAAPIFGVAEKNVTKEQRGGGKLSNHSGNYGSGPNVLVTRALKDGIKGIDYKFAQHILEIRHLQLPGLKVWWKDVERSIQQTRTLTTCFGRRKIFFGRRDENTYRSAYSYEPQSTCGDVCNILFSRLYNHLQKETVPFSDELRPFPLIQIHDEVVTRCPNIPEIIDYTVKKYYEFSKIPLRICSDEDLIIPIEIKVGKNWKDTKEYV